MYSLTFFSFPLMARTTYHLLFIVAHAGNFECPGYLKISVIRSKYSRPNGIIFIDTKGLGPLHRRLRRTKKYVNNTTTALLLKTSDQVRPSSPCEPFRRIVSPVRIFFNVCHGFLSLKCTGGRDSNSRHLGFGDQCSTS